MLKRTDKAWAADKRACKLQACERPAVVFWGKKARAAEKRAAKLQLQACEVSAVDFCSDSWSGMWDASFGDGDGDGGHECSDCGGVLTESCDDSSDDDDDDEGVCGDCCGGVVSGSDDFEAKEFLRNNWIGYSDEAIEWLEHIHNPKERAQNEAKKRKPHGIRTRRV